jgi:D-alanyl-D-alanine carboxypeptidase
MRPDNLFSFPVKTLDTAGRLHWHPAVEWTGGGLISTSRDLARWGAAIYSSGPFGPVYGHAGWIPGYVSSLRHYPEHGVTIAFQINTDTGIIDCDDDVLRIIEERLMQVFIGRKK